MYNQHINSWADFVVKITAANGHDFSIGVHTIIIIS